jgi:hypothetical protein
VKIQKKFKDDQRLPSEEAFGSLGGEVSAGLRALDGIIGLCYNLAKF